MKLLYWKHAILYTGLYIARVTQKSNGGSVLGKRKRQKNRLLKLSAAEESALKRTVWGPRVRVTTCTYRHGSEKGGYFSDKVSNELFCAIKHHLILHS